MTFSVFFLVLLAALTHALWNSWLKVSGDRLVALAAMGVGWTIVGLAALPLVGMPQPQAWPFLVASTIVHTIYTLILIAAYRLGDLSVVYPIARGLGPLIVALVSTFYFGDELGTNGTIGLAFIVAGVVGLGMPSATPSYPSLGYSVLTGALIGAYTLLDGLGGRNGGSPHVYATWLFLLTGFPVIVIAIAEHRVRFITLARPIWKKGVTAGVLSAGAYWIVIWAMSDAHMGLVAALRESSVVFVALIGAFLLKERVRWFAVALVFVGVVFTKLA